MSLSSPLSEQATPTSPKITRWDPSERTLHGDHVVQSQTIARKRWGLGNSDFSDETCRRKKCALCQRSPTCPSHGIVAAASLWHYNFYFTLRVTPNGLMSKNVPQPYSPRQHHQCHMSCNATPSAHTPVEHLLTAMSCTSSLQEAQMRPRSPRWRTKERKRRRCLTLQHDHGFCWKAWSGSCEYAYLPDDASKKENDIHRHHRQPASTILGIFMIITLGSYHACGTNFKIFFPEEKMKRKERRHTRNTSLF